MRWVPSVFGMTPVFDNDEEKQAYEEQLQRQRLAELRAKYPLTEAAWEAIESYRQFKPDTVILQRLHRVFVIEGIPSHADQGIEDDIFYYRLNGQWQQAYTNHQNLRRSRFESNPGADAVPAEAEVAIVFMEEPFKDPPIYIYVRTEKEEEDKPPSRIAERNPAVMAASQRIWQALKGHGDLQQALISYKELNRCLEHRLDAAQELGNYLGTPCDLWTMDDPFVHKWLADYCKELFLIIGDGPAELTLGQQRREGIILGWLRCPRPLASLEELIGVDLLDGLSAGVEAESLAYLFGVDDPFKGEWLERMAQCLEKEHERIKMT